ncbi:hypothetical protein RJ640_025079 [Escallonia rubra]|uniref:Uncharacterized protein n=1 Tax=Escallonia rubra TaxID=112253 RepID=A0AA88U1G1_9ASTE|nr:hypothetical protein RJ640_025079 [Escallonia rubra]
MNGQNSISLGMETKRISSRVSVEDEPEDMVSEQVRQKFISSIVQKLTLYSDPTTYGICIYKVPDKLRKMNEEAYRPRLVSVGPFHQGRPHLQAMERYKWRCVKKFLQRVNSDIAGVARVAWEMESSVRASYGDTFDNFSSQAFSEMIMLDGIFIVELLLESSGLTKGRDGAVLFDNPWMRSDILHDMMLLENQLPIFVPLQYWLITDIGTAISFYDIIHTYFKSVGIMSRLATRAESDHTRHLVEFLEYCHRPSTPRETPIRPFREKLEHTRSAMELHEAGVKFERRREGDNSLFAINFADGVLTLPQLTVNEWTETFFRNLIAFEQCERRIVTKAMTSYIILMDSLINTSHDVDLLIRCDIIKNFLGDYEQVTNLFNNLHKETLTDNSNFYFAKLCEDLNEYSRDYLHQWKAAWFTWKRMLRHDYFSNPWSAISVIAAVVLLILTVTQTVCSILQL